MAHLWLLVNSFYVKSLLLFDELKKWPILVFPDHCFDKFYKETFLILYLFQMMIYKSLLCFLLIFYACLVLSDRPGANIIKLLRQ